jgi:mannose/fructose/N-acetylgalactosamine-specific phosphotransferase system component IIB
MVILLRVDDRLIHGLVVVSWTSQLKPDVIVVANDAAAGDAFASNTLKLAKPPGIDLYIWRIEETITKLDHPKIINKRVFVITKDLNDTLLLCDQYDKIPAVNIGIGGTSKTVEMKAILPEVYMGVKEFEITKKIHSKGIEVFAQLTPTKPKLSFEEFSKTF